MILDLAEDLQNAAAEMPTQHSAYAGIRARSDAFVDCIVGVLDRPWLLKQTIINQIRSAGLETSLKEFVGFADAQLEIEPYWVSLKHCTSVTRPWNNVVAISINRGLAHCASRPGEIDDCDLATHRPIRSHRFSAQAFESVSVQPITQEISVVGFDGMVESQSLRRRVQLRSRSTCFAQLGAGFIGVGLDDHLRFYSAEGEPVMRVDLRLPKSGCSLHVGTAGECAVLLAGDRHGSQRILILAWHPHADPHCVVWPLQDQLVTAASIDTSGSRLAIATLGRELLICDVDPPRIKAKINLSRIGGRPLSEIVAVSLSPGPEEQVVFADVERIFGIWNVADAELRRCGAYKAVRERTPLVAIQWLGDGERFAVATQQMINIFSTSSDGSGVSSGTPVGAIGVHRDGWIALTHPMEKRVTWFENGREIAAHATGSGEPGSLAIRGQGKEIAVGVANSVILYRPDRQPTHDQDLPAFDQRMVSVLSTPSQVFAVSISGEIQSADFQRRSFEILSSAQNNWEHCGACFAGTNAGIFWWGQETSGSAHSKVFWLGANGVKHLIAELDRQIKSVAGAGETRVFLATDGWVYRYDKTWRGWRQLVSRAVKVQLLCACGTETVLAMRKDVPWLELWSVKDLSTLAAAYVPVEVACLNCDETQIAIGTMDGGYIHMIVRGTKWRLG